VTHWKTTPPLPNHAACLGTLTTAERSNVFEEVFYEGSYYPEAIESGYFKRKFPQVAAINRKLQPRKASNQALQPRGEPACFLSL